MDMKSEGPVENAGAAEESILRIRTSTKADLPTLSAFQTALAFETEGVLLDVDTVRGGILAVIEGRAPGDYWTADISGETVGCLMINPEWSDWRAGTQWWVNSLYVAPRWRRAGVAKAMLARVAAEARGKAIRVKLYVERGNTAAAGLYRSVGMEPQPYELFGLEIDPSSHVD